MTPAESRRALGMTVNQFADALGVSPVTVRRWEMDPIKTSHRVPGAGTLKAIELLGLAQNSAQVQRFAPAKPESKP